MGHSSSNLYLNKLLTRRVIAFLIDLSFIKYINYSFALSWKVFLKSFFILPPEIAQKIDPLSSNLSTLTLPLIFLSYFTLTHFLSHGKTIGKIICQTKIETNIKNHRVSLNVFKKLGFCFCFLLGLSLTYSLYYKRWLRNPRLGFKYSCHKK